MVFHNVFNAHPPYSVHNAYPRTHSSTTAAYTAPYPSAYYARRPATVRHAHPHTTYLIIHAKAAQYIAKLVIPPLTASLVFLIFPITIIYIMGCAICVIFNFVKIAWVIKSVESATAI